MTILDFATDRRQFLAAIAVAASMPTVALAKDPMRAAHAEIRALVDRYVAEGKVANMVVAVGGRMGPPDFFSAGPLEFGGEALADPDSLYRIYSMSKPVTGCAIMMLVEEGKLTLDTPLSDIFPGFAQMNVLTDPENSLAVRPATKPILIRHLVTHSSGLAYDSTAPALLAKLYKQEALSMRGAPPEAAPHGPAGLIHYAEAAASLPLMFEPGSKWNYSIGLDVAGAVVEKLSGMPFEEFLEQRIFAPLGMADTFFTVPEAKLDRLTANYKHTSDGLELIETGQGSIYAFKPAAPSGGGGLVSSARDYSQFMAMLLGEGQLGSVSILKPETARLMMSNVMDLGVLATTAIAETGYGVGGRSVIVDTPGGEGVGTYGWYGAANTLAFVDRANDIYIVLMTQVRSWWPNPIYSEPSAALYADLASG